MTPTKFVMASNNGTTALMTESHYELFKKCASADEAFRRGVRWLVYISQERARRQRNLAALVTGTYENFQQIAPDRLIRDDSIFVPFSNGPQHWEEEKRYVISYDTLLQMIMRGWA